MNLVFLLEERSAKFLLEILLPKILPSGTTYQLIAHDGKQDLAKSIPRKLTAWNTPETKFVVLHDQDSNDCIALKANLRAMCKNSDKEVLIRIACRELESWYFGDLHAVSCAYGRDLTPLTLKSKYRNPDKIGNPKQELRKLVPEYEQIAGAKTIGPYMDLLNNTSTSFNVFLKGVQQLIAN